MVGVFERVYEVGPVFRAEPHDTTRHLAEYVSLDAEMGFISDHTDVMAVLRAAISGMIDAVADRAASEVALLELELPVVPAGDPRDRLRGGPSAHPGRAPERRPLGELDLPGHDVGTVARTSSSRYPMAATLTVPTLGPRLEQLDLLANWSPVGGASAVTT